MEADVAHRPHERVVLEERAVFLERLLELGALESFAAVCTPLLKRGGFLAFVLPKWAGRRGDLIGEAVRMLEQAGLRYWQHVIALTAAVRESAFLPIRQVHLVAAGEAGGPALESCHLNVLVFRRPERTLLAADAAAAEAEPITARAA